MDIRNKHQSLECKKSNRSENASMRERRTYLYWRLIIADKIFKSRGGLSHVKIKQTRIRRKSAFKNNRLWEDERVTIILANNRLSTDNWLWEMHREWVSECVISLLWVKLLLDGLNSFFSPVFWILCTRVSFLSESLHSWLFFFSW